MADILIKKMELPKEPKLLLLGIDEFGNVCRVSSEHLHFKGLYDPKAIELPPHGRCIDADQLQDVLRLVLSLVVSNELTEKEISLVHRTIGAISEAINDLDTVLEASNGSDN